MAKIHEICNECLLNGKCALQDTDAVESCEEIEDTHFDGDFYYEDEDFSYEEDDSFYENEDDL